MSTVITLTFLKFENISNFKNWIISYTLGQFILVPVTFNKFHRNKFRTSFILLKLFKDFTNSWILHNKLAKILFYCCLNLTIWENLLKLLKLSDTRTKLPIVSIDVADYFINIFFNNIPLNFDHRYTHTCNQTFSKSKRSLFEIFKYFEVKNFQSYGQWVKAIGLGVSYSVESLMMIMLKLPNIIGSRAKLW